MADAYRFQSTHPVRGATQIVYYISKMLEFQSTHPVRGATLRGLAVYNQQRFQSTHPVRGATQSRGEGNTPTEDFNPRTP